MPDAQAVSVCKAVTAQIQAAVDADNLSQTIILERSYADWHLDLLKADGSEGNSEPARPRVDVVLVTTAQETELAARGVRDYSIAVDIAVRQRLGQPTQNDDTGRIAIETLDGLMLLVQEINELFMPERLTTFTDGVWQETRIMVAPLLKHLRELRQFTGIIRVTFKAPKAI